MVGRHVFLLLGYLFMNFIFIFIIIFFKLINPRVDLLLLHLTAEDLSLDL